MRVRWLLVALVVGHLGAGHLAAQPVSVKEVEAGFKRNREFLKSPRISLRWTHRKLEAARQAMRTSADDIEKSAAKPDVPEDKRQAILRQAKLLRSMADTGIETILFQEYWTNWKGAHVRIPQLPAGMSQPLWDFPEIEISRDSLLSVYRNYTVASYRPDETPHTRVWNGLRGEMRSGRVSDRPLPESLPQFTFPPLSVSDQKWGAQSAWHPIDNFFAELADKAVMVGPEKVKDRTLHRLRHVTLSEAKGGFERFPGKTEVGQLVDVLVDTKRGYLPVKMEWRIAVYRQGKLFRMTETPFKEVEVKTIHPVKGGGFYPTKGTVIMRIDDPKHAQDQMAIDALMRGTGKIKRPMVPASESEWEVLKFSSDVTLTEEMLALPFPDQTNYFDETKQQSMVETVPLTVPAAKGKK